jgi:hypothetical protein
LKIRELRTQVETANAAAAQQKKDAIKTTVETTIKEYEKAIGNVPLRKIMSDRLTAELEAGTKLEETETMKALKSMAPARNLTREAGPDAGGAGVTDDVKIDARAKELMESDAHLKSLTAKNYLEGYKEATRRAYAELSAA